jgi:hypothetical protein
MTFVCFNLVPPREFGDRCQEPGARHYTRGEKPLPCLFVGATVIICCTGLSLAKISSTLNTACFFFGQLEEIT